MRYTVVLIPSAEEELAHLWTVAANRRAVTVASNQIEGLLRTSPLKFNADSDGNRRVVIGPLEVVYRVSEDDCLVQINQIVANS
jgi:hypothetical protein